MSQNKKSSCIKSLEYLPNNCVIVEFYSEDRYMFSNVPQSVLSEFASSDSKGTFFAKNIRNKYSFEKLA